MSIEIQTFIDQLERELKGIKDTELDEPDRVEHIKAALEKYSRDRPDEAHLDKAGDGGKYYEINTTTFTSWVEGFSRILKIEYPAATIADDERPRFLLPAHDWALYWEETKHYLYLPNHAPKSSEEMRITYTTPYAFSGSPEEVDIPAQDFYALCALAASYCCGALAAKYGQTLDSTIGADAVQYGSKSGRYERRADKLLQKYNDHMGIPKSGVKASSVIHEWDPGRPAMDPRRRRRVR